jgi:DNA-binding NarL/FixJ family response regulator
MSKRRILIADDHSIVAEGLRELFEPEFEVVGIVADGREMLAAAKNLQPDLIVSDVSMPGLNGIEAALQLRSLGVEAKVVFLTMHRDVVYARRAMEAGAAGFVLKHSAARELVTAVREALQGKTYVTPQIAGELLQSYREADSRLQDPVQQLTLRQREVLQLLAEGRSAKEVARTLRISTRTVEFHRDRIKELLGIQTTVEMVQYAIRQGIVSL